MDMLAVFPMVPFSILYVPKVKIENVPLILTGKQVRSKDSSFYKNLADLFDNLSSLSG